MEITVTVTSKYRVTLPLEVRERLDVGPGDKIVFTTEGESARLTIAKQRPIADFFGSIPALPSETADLDREINEAIQEEAEQISREHG